MTVNFKIEKNFDIDLNGRRIDIHNNFDFNNYEYKIIERRLLITWIKSSGNWVNKNEFSKLIFIHSNVFFLNIVYDNKEYEYPQDDKCLSEISFFPSSERLVNNQQIIQESPTIGDDIIYTFQSQQFIRVGCDNVELFAE